MGPCEESTAFPITVFEVHALAWVVSALGVYAMSSPYQRELRRHGHSVGHTSGGHPYSGTLGPCEESTAFPITTVFEVSTLVHALTHNVISMGPVRTFLPGSPPEMAPQLRTGPSAASLVVCLCSATGIVYKSHSIATHEPPPPTTGRGCAGAGAGMRFDWNQYCALEW